jgi:hypothetical protein
VTRALSEKQGSSLLADGRRSGAAQRAQLLKAWRDGDKRALEQLELVVESELRDLTVASQEQNGSYSATTNPLNE